MNAVFNYSINGESNLRLLLENPITDASNNLAKNITHKVAKIRNNSLFLAMTKGANTTMTLLSIVQTCVLNLVIPEKYNKHYLENYKNIGK